MMWMLLWVLRENEDVVQVNKDRHIKHVAEHIIHKCRKAAGTSERPIGTTNCVDPVLKDCASCVGDPVPQGSRGAGIDL